MPGVISISTKNSETERVCVERKKIRLDRFFSLICPLKKEGIFIQGQNSSVTLKKQQVMRQHVKQKEIIFFFSELKTRVGWCCSFTLESSGFQKCQTPTTILQKAGVLLLLKIRPSSYGEEPCELLFLSFLCCICSSHLLGNPPPAPNYVKKYDFVLSI